MLLLLSYLQVNRTTLKTKIAIPETIRQDKGNYKLVAENCYGKAQHVIQVEILGKKFSTSFSMLDFLFVISWFDL